MKEGRRDLFVYVVAVLGYIGIGWYAKGMLTWNIAFPYFVFVVEVLPRLYDRFTKRGARESAGPT